MGEVPAQNPVRHDWYQTETVVVITVLIKNVQRDDLRIDFGERRVRLGVKTRDAEHNVTFNLSHVVAPDQCGYTITPSKIEIKLKKLEGVLWSKLEGEPEAVEPRVANAGAAASDGPLPYPTSVRGKDWAAIDKQIREQEKEESLQGEEALNKLFQDIYSKGGDEVKMAMNKSYVESGGTVLSTNWDEIKREKVPVKPADGFEWKEWK